MQSSERLKESRQLRADVFHFLFESGFGPDRITRLIYGGCLIVVLNNFVWFFGYIAVFGLAIAILIPVIDRANERLYEISKGVKRTVYDETGVPYPEIVEITLSYKDEAKRSAICILRWVILWVVMIGTAFYLTGHPFPFFLPGFT